MHYVFNCPITPVKKILIPSIFTFFIAAFAGMANEHLGTDLFTGAIVGIGSYMIYNRITDYKECNSQMTELGVYAKSIITPLN